MKRTYALESSENEYYARISRKLKNMKYLLLLLMVVCALLTLWAYRDRLTYENLRYLFRDMDSAGNATFSSDTVYYTADEKNTFIYYRDDLAVGSSSGITFHRWLGGRSFSDEVNFRSPVLRGSEKYMIAYDVGGKSFYVYNSLGRVYNEKLDTEIISAAAADNGGFCVVAKNKKGGSDVYIYDKNFGRVAALTRALDVYTAGFLGDGRLYICESAVEDASLYTDITFYTVGNEETEGTIRESGLVLEIGDVKGGMYILSDRGLTLKTDNGEFEHSFATADLLYADASRDGVCVLLKENTSGEECGAYLFTPDGDSRYYAVPKGAKGIALCGGRMCVLYDGAVTVLYDGDVSEIDIPTGTRAILPVSSNEIFVCYNDYARIFSVKQR